jgi:hypothetical protein
MNHETWSRTEKAAGKRAFDLAYRRQTAAIMEEVRKAAAALKEPDDLWKLNDYLWEQRREIGRIYDFRYSGLIMVFGCLVRDGWLKMEDLAGLSAKKLDTIRKLVDLSRH